MVTEPQERHIQGWKEIAARLGRDERTAKRWEKGRGLPVRRIPGGGRANVYLVERELAAWLRTGTPVSAAAGGHETARSPNAFPGHPPAPLSLAPSPETGPALTAPGIVGAADANAGTPGRPVFARGPRRRPAWVLAGVAAFLTVAAFAVQHTRHRGTTVPEPATGAVTLRPRTSPEVDQLYLQGVYLREARTADSLRAAHDLFEQAIARDPRFAPAYSGLALTFLLLREYATVPSAEAYALAGDAAGRALALDPDLADAHAALGFIDFFSLWQAADATREFETAIRLDGRNSIAHHWYGSVLMHQGRYAEALAQLDEAQHLNPTSNAILSTRALALGYGGRREEAFRLLTQLIRSDPTAPGPHRNLAYVSLTEPQDTRLFVHEMRRFAELQGDAPSLGSLRAAEAARQRGGDAAMWTALLAAPGVPSPGNRHLTMLTVEAETALGRREAAVDDLERLARQRDSNVLGLVVSPELVPLHHDPRFREIAGRLGLQADPVALPPSSAPAIAALHTRAEHP